MRKAVLKKSEEAEEEYEEEKRLYVLREEKR